MRIAFHDFDEGQVIDIVTLSVDIRKQVLDVNGEGHVAARRETP